MVQDALRSKILLDAFKERAAQRKGRPSNDPCDWEGSAGVGPSGKSKERLRGGGGGGKNIKKTPRRGGGGPPPPPPYSAFFKRPCDRVAETEGVARSLEEEAEA